MTTFWLPIYGFSSDANLHTLTSTLVILYVLRDHFNYEGLDLCRKEQKTYLHYLYEQSRVQSVFSLKNANHILKRKNLLLLWLTAAFLGCKKKG